LTHCQQVKELLPLYPLDLLDEREREAVREHLESGCPLCAAELAAARHALDLLPLGLPPEEPSPMVRARLLAAVRRSRAPGARPMARSWARAAAAAVLAASAAALVSGVVVGRRYQAELAALREDLRRQGEELAALREQAGQARESILLVSSPAVKVIDLAGQGPGAGSSARVFWDPGRRQWRLYAANLAPAGSGKTYQLWLITPSAKLSAGTFDPGAEGEASGSVEVPPDSGPILAAAVTDEPAGGSPQPTGAILLLGKLPA
jgi:anti-sigma-K factor RskA